MPQLLRPGTLAIALVALVAWSPAGRADDELEDSIVLDLASDGWVETQTAQVILSVNASMRQDEAANVRATITDQLNRLAKGADWHITRFNRNADRSGLDAWYIQAEARIADTALDGLRQAAEKASKPGLQISIATINFTPTVAEVETTRAKLRQDLYASAQAELKRVNAAFPDRPYRIGVINFTQMPIGLAKSDAAYERASLAAAPPAPNINVQDHLEMHATVILRQGADGED